MGLGPKFSSNSQPKLGEPQAHRFSIERLETVGANVVALVRYTDASEFGGLKLLVYRGVSERALRASPLLDPHFLEHSPLPKPFARFEPTEAGLAAAFQLAEVL